MRKGFSWHDFGIVFQYYLRKQVKSKAYIIVTVLLCAVSFASCFLLSAFSGGKDKSTVYIVDRTGIFAEELSNTDIPENYFQEIALDFNTDSGLSDSDIARQVEEDELAYAVFADENGNVKLTLYDVGKVGAADAQALLNLAKTVYQNVNIQSAGISQEVLESINRQVLFEEINPVQNSENFWVTYILYMLMVVAIVMYSSSAGSEVAYLKTNKVMEIVTTSIKPLPFYLGVTISIGLAGLIQLAAVVVFFLLSFNLAGMDLSQFGEMGITIAALKPDEVAALLIMFIGGFMLYSFINTAIASIVNRNDDLMTTVVPVEMLAMVQFFVSIFALESDGMLSVVCSYIPFTSPAVMFVRYMMGYAGAVEIAVSAVILYATALLVAVCGSKFFSRGVVYYGTVKEFKLKA